MYDTCAGDPLCFITHSNHRIILENQVFVFAKLSSNDGFWVSFDYYDYFDYY